MSMINAHLRHPRLAVLSWLLASFFVVFQFFLQSTSSVLSPYWTLDFHLTPLSLSILSSAFFYTYVIMQVPVGMLYDHYQPEQLITRASALVALGCLLLAITPWFWLGFIARLLLGSGCAFGFVGMLKVTALVFKSRRFALMVGVSESFTMLGVTLGIMLLAWTVSHYPWRWSMAICGVVAGLGSITALLIMHYQGPDVHPVAPHPFALNRVWRDLQQTMCSRQVWLGGLYSFFMFAMVNVFTSLWGVMFLTHTQNISHQDAANVMSMVFVGIAIGGPILGLLTHRFFTNHVALLICALLGSVLMSYLVWMPELSMRVMYVGYIVMGACCASYIVCFTVIKESLPHHLQATGLAFSNMITMAGAPILQTLIGAILEYCGGSSHANALNYRLALLILPLGMLVAFILALAIKPQEVALQPDSSLEVD